jgi:esterase/lipase superfamily enzyme
VVYQEKLDPTKHFVIKEVAPLTESAWGQIVKNSNEHEALIFVHGYNNSFDDGLYRQAQIIWDLQYKGLAILFTWASRGDTLEYLYDQQSAWIARKSFADLLTKLQGELGITKINVIAHSMGNVIVADTLANFARGAGSIKLQELILAAPDLDWNYFEQIGPELSKTAKGVTLYASAADKAMMLSRKLSRVPRAGDIVKGEPIIVPGIESIDVTVLGEELFGLNHDVFAASRSVIDDMKLILTKNWHPPIDRLSQIRGMPLNKTPPRFWKYAN